MCYTPCGCLLEFVPYILLVTVPFLGSFSGTELVLRLSLLLLGFIISGELISKHLYNVLPHLKLCVLSIVLVYLPMSFIPYAVVWLYSWLLWLLEPVLLTAEMVLALNCVMHLSHGCVEKIEEDEDQAWKWKLLLSVFSAGCYALVAVIVSVVYTEGTDLQFWMVALVLSFSVLLAAHNMMWMSHQGIVSDVAFVTLSSLGVLYIMKEEINMVKSPLQTPSSWYRYQSKGSMWQEAYKVINMSIDTAQVAMLYIQRFLRPLVITMLCVRLYSIIFIVHRAIRNMDLENDDLDLEDMETGAAPWRSPTLMKCAIVVLVTQYTVRLFERSSSRHMPFTWLDTVLPDDVILGRVLQVLLGNCFYIWRLYRAEDWQWSHWLSPGD
ncbi:uncharacterized protein LOC127852282 [Dreissena polymorpha]|uniref:uncharacterized protein LOC127852282 n=1 Tax=Dreissena polymorpha TaxID=45954 RepID=UPI002264723E|nr:uncharacterized protein LOC127852282 [Dreissena polymorpha]